MGLRPGHGQDAPVRRSAGGAWGPSARQRGPAAELGAPGATPTGAQWQGARAAPLSCWTRKLVWPVPRKLPGCRCRGPAGPRGKPPPDPGGKGRRERRGLDAGASCSGTSCTEATWTSRPRTLLLRRPVGPRLRGICGFWVGPGVPPRSAADLLARGAWTRREDAFVRPREPRRVAPGLRAVRPGAQWRGRAWRLAGPSCFSGMHNTEEADVPSTHSCDAAPRPARRQTGGSSP